MKNEKFTIKMLRNSIIAIHDNCLKTKKRLLLDTMISIYKEICFNDEELIGEIIYDKLIGDLDDIIETEEGGI